MGSFRHWLHVARAYGGFDWQYFDRVIAITILSLLTSPLRLAERALFGRRIHETEISHAPVFILGHWRTGTTYLQYLLTQDSATGYIPLFQTLAPESFLVGQKTLQPLVGLRAPKTRPMDNMHISMKTAQEDEFAIANMCAESFYHGWYFPREMKKLFHKFALFEGISDKERANWERVYLYNLKAATYHFGGKRLLIKNPVNTSRIPALLEIFPDAKFVHIYRDPYVVYKSSLRLHRSVIDLVGLQNVDDDLIEQNVLHFFRETMDRYFKDRHLIPEGNLIEVRYEDLEIDPIHEVERIYAGLDLPGWEAAKPDIQAFADSQRGYVKNRFTMSEADMLKVEEHWEKALNIWGYSRPSEPAEARTPAEVPTN